MQQSQFDLDTPLFRLAPNDGSESFTVRDSVNGCFITGGIGSGKTSAAAKLIALKYLKAGYGGLVLTAKEDELANWQEYCSATGRSEDLIIVSPGSGNAFNFLEYESSGRAHLSYTDNIFQVLKTVIKAGEEKKSGKNDDQFWENALEMFIINIIDLSLLAYGKVTVPILYDIAQSVPRRMERRSNADTAGEPENAENAYTLAAKAAKANVKSQIKAWRVQLPKGIVDNLNAEQYEALLNDSLPDYRTLRLLNEFFLKSLLGIGEKTRSIIDFYFTGFLFRFLREPLYSLFCRHTSFTPEDCLDGKIIILNLPVKIYNKAGQDAQIMFKYIWQRAMEKRDVSKNDRPLFLFADESQLFLHPHDSEYQATARSSRIATVYITQNLSNYHANMGGDNSEAKVNSFLATLATKLFLANTDLGTNSFASSLIGEQYVEDVSRSTQLSQGFSMSNSTSFKLEKIVRPEEFVGLKSGGPLNKFQVHGYIHMQGKNFASGGNHQKICFNQNPKI